MHFLCVSLEELLVKTSNLGLFRRVACGGGGEGVNHKLCLFDLKQLIANFNISTSLRSPKD